MRILNNAQAQLHHLLRNGGGNQVPPNLPSVIGPTGYPLLDQILALGKPPEQSSQPGTSAASNRGLPFQDESILAVSVGAQNVNDPGILQTNHSKSDITYSREQLLGFRKSPHASCRPGCLDPNHNNSKGFWDPEIWISHHKLQETKNGETSEANWVAKPNAPTLPGQRKSDPRRGFERTSIDSGFVSPVKRNENYYHDSMSRRAGSGRLMLRDSEFNSDRMRDFDFTMERTFSSEDADEPEWFSSGPTSKHDMIELHGFEDIPEEKTPNSAKKSNGKAEASAETKPDKAETTPAASSVKDGPKGRSTPTSTTARENAEVAAPHSPIADNEAQASSKDKNAEEDKQAGSTSAESNEKPPSDEKEKNSNCYNNFKFNFDQFFQYDWSAVSNSNKQGGSRFKQWFKKRDNSMHGDHDSSLRSSFQEDILKNILNDSTNSQSNRRKQQEFAQRKRNMQRLQQQQILEQQKRDAESAVLLQMLHHNQNKQNNEAATRFLANMMTNSSASAAAQNNARNIRSLQEIEAHMQRGFQSMHNYGNSQPHKSGKEIAAFKKMLRQANSSQLAPGATGVTGFGLPNPHQQYPLQQPNFLEPGFQMQQAVNPFTTLIQIQVMDFFKNFWNFQAAYNASASTVNPSAKNFAPESILINNANRRPSSNLLHRDSTLYHRRVKFNENS